jgi:predicted small secreted protein
MSFLPLVGRMRPLPAIAVAAVALVMACNTSGGGDDIDIRISSPTPTPIPASPTATATPTPKPTPTPGPNVCGRNPDPAPAAVLQVQAPEPGDKVKSPFHVRGWGSEIGNQDIGALVALVDKDGDVKKTVSVPPQPRQGRVAAPGIKVTENTRPFGADLLVDDLDITEETPFCIWAFVETTESGIPKDIVQVPVIIVPPRRAEE